jgi:hypothetical protein
MFISPHDLPKRHLGFLSILANYTYSVISAEAMIKCNLMRTLSFTCKCARSMRFSKANLLNDHPDGEDCAIESAKKKSERQSPQMTFRHYGYSAGII